MNDQIEKLLESEGWTIECESPLELRHEESGSLVSGSIARSILMELMLDEGKDLEEKYDGSKQYIALEGNEYGCNIIEGYLTTLEQAEKKYNSFFEENGFGAGGIYKIANGEIKCIKSNCNL